LPRILLGTAYRREQRQEHKTSFQHKTPFKLWIHKSRLSLETSARFAKSLLIDGSEKRTEPYQNEYRQFLPVETE